MRNLTSINPRTSSLIWAIGVLFAGGGVWAQTADLFISEYVEGSSNNKAIELFNGTGSDLSLSGYEVRLFANGATSPNNTIDLSTVQSSLPDGGVIVLKHSSFTSYTGQATDSGVANFNGDDVVGLFKEDVLIDVIGEIGVRENAFQNVTLVRSSSVIEPKAIYDASEWESFPIDTFSDLGMHTFIDPGEPDPEPSEFPADFTASGSGLLGVTLSWTDAGGAQLPFRYLIYVTDDGSIPVPTDGVAVSNDTDISDGLGAFNVALGAETYEVGGLSGNTEYTFSIYPYTNSGTRVDYKIGSTPDPVPTATFTTSNVLLAQEFNSLGDWEVVTLGAAAEWGISSQTALANAFNSSGPADDWLISPAVNLDADPDLILTFDVRNRFADSGFNPALSVLLSTDYDGTGSASAVQSALWTAIPVSLPPENSDVVANSGNLPLSSFSGTGYFAFRYQSSGTSASSSSEWAVDNVFVYPSSQQAGVLNVLVDPAQVFEDAGNSAATVTISVDEAVGSDLPLSLQSDNASVISLPATAQIDSGNSSVTVSVDVATGLSLSSAVDVTLTVSATGYVPGNTSLRVLPAAAKFLDLSLDQSSVDEDAGTGALNGTVTLSALPDSYPLTVSLSSSDTTEAVVPPSLVWQDGDGLSKTFAVDAVADNVFDLDAVVTITASQADYGSGSRQLTVRNVDDVPPLTLTISPSSVFENAGSAAATLTVELGAAPVAGYPVTVTLSSDDSDNSEISLPDAISISSSDGLTKQISIGVLADSTADGNQLITVTASASNYASGSDTLEVADVDSVSQNPVLNLLIEPASFSEGEVATGTVVLSQIASTPVLVQLVSGDPSEISIPASVEVASGEVSASFVIAGLNDGVIDGAQSVTVIAAADGWVGSQRSVTVHDVDVPKTIGLAITPSSIKEGGSAQAVVSVSTAPVEGITVKLLSSDSTEVVLSMESLTFIPGDLSRTILISAREDDLVDGNNTVLINASAPGYMGTSAEITIEDGDLPNLLGVQIAPDALNEGQQTPVVVTLQRTVEGQAVEVSLSVSDSTEASLSESRIVFPAGNAQESSSVTLSAILDGEIDSNIGVTVTASANGFASTSDAVTIVNVDVARTLALSLDRTTASEGESFLGEVTLSVASSEPLEVSLSSSGHTDFSFPASVMVPAGSTRSSFSVSVAADDGYEPPETYTLSASASGYGGGSISLSILNTDSRISWVRPLAGVTQTFAVDEPVTLLVEVSDSGTDFTEVIFSADGGFIASDSTPPFSATYVSTTESVQPIVLEALLLAPSGNSETASVQIQIKNSPVTNDANFVSQMIEDLLPGIDPVSRQSYYESILQATGGDRTAVVEAMLEEPVLETTLQAVETTLLMLGRYPTYDELFVGPTAIFLYGSTVVEIPSYFDIIDTGPNLFFDVNTFTFPGGIRGMAIALMEFDDQVFIEFGGNPTEVANIDYFSTLWWNRHSTAPTAQQIVQASSRISSFTTGREAQYSEIDSTLYGRARFVEALVLKETFKFETDIIYDPPNQFSADDSLTGLLYGALWGNFEEDGDFGISLPAAAAWRGMSPSQRISRFLDHPNYWSRFDYNWLGSTAAGDGSDWKVSDWFGWVYYNASNWAWVYSPEHRWIYAANDDAQGGGIWYYDLSLGWLYTSSQAYPWVFQSSAGSWYWYQRSSTNPRWFFSVAEGDWISVP